VHRSAILCVAPERAVAAFHAVKRAHIVCSLGEDAIRLSPHFYNTVEEMEKVIDVLSGVV
jgi:selenocysteine lyase/cysteine desulfurase